MLYLVLRVLFALIGIIMMIEAVGDVIDPSGSLKTAFWLIIVGIVLVAFGLIGRKAA